MISAKTTIARDIIYLLTNPDHGASRTNSSGLKTRKIEKSDSDLHKHFSSSVGGRPGSSNWKKIAQANLKRGSPCGVDSCKKMATKKCGRCKQEVYCSTRCQKIKWNVHKKTCSLFLWHRKISQNQETFYKIRLNFTDFLVTS